MNLSGKRVQNGAMSSDESKDLPVSVLIVDDQEPFRTAARAVVAATEGFQVVGESETGEDALEAVGRLRPNLVLMDINLPGIDGLEATRRIRTGAPNDTVVLLLSTYEEEDYGSGAAECGAAAFISKSEFAPRRLADAWAAAGD